MTKKLFCQKCSQSTSAVLRRTITCNGASLIYWFCLNGAKPHRAHRGMNISHATVDRMGIEIETIPTVHFAAGVTLCEVLGCLNQGAELHHWAPRGIFREDAEQWPKSYLCPQHHAEWHEAMKSQ